MTETKKLIFSYLIKLISTMVQFNPNEDNKFLWKCWGCSWNNMIIYRVITAIVGIVGVILLIVLLALSIRDVDENELVIPYYKVSRRVGTIEGAGKHTFTPDIKLFTYDRKFITNDIEVECISKDGLIITLIVTQQYQLKKEELKSVLFEFGEQEALDVYIDTIAQDTVRDVCALFNGDEFFSGRGNVELTLINNITSAMNSAQARVIPGFVQLKNIVLPTAILTAIQNKQLALEDVDVANSERAQVLIEAETRRQEAKLDADILLVGAKAAADGIKLAASERANARLLQWAERAKAFIINIEALNIDAESYVDDYLFPRLISHTLTPAQQACLQSCPTAPCWYCFGTANPAVVV